MEETGMDCIQVYLLQRPLILRNGQEVRFSYKKVEALIYYLMVVREAERAAVVELLWEDTDRPQAYQNLRHALYILRQELGADFLDSEYKSRLRLNPRTEISCDLWDLRDRGEMTTCSACKGQFLQDFSVRRAKNFEEWKETMQLQVQRFYLNALDRQARLAEENGNITLAIQQMEFYLRREPLSEEHVVFLMRLYQRNNEYSKAVGAYRELVRRLADELGIMPLKETTAVYYDILNHWNSRATAQEPLIEDLAVGKLRPRQRICEAIDCLSTGRGRPGTLLLQGENGAGKSFLLRHVCRIARKKEIEPLVSICYASERETPFQAWRAILMQAQTLPDEPIAGLAARILQRAQEELPDYSSVQEDTLFLLARMAKVRPLMLVLEDIQWMDRVSMAILNQAMRRLTNERPLILCSGSSILPEPSWRFVYDSIQDKLLEVLTIRNFTLEETQEFLSIWGMQSHSRELMAQVYACTEGNAARLRQLFPVLAENDGADCPEDKLKKMLALRLQGLQPQARQVLEQIALFQEGAPFSLLAAVAERTNLELLVICDDLERRALIHERNTRQDPVLCLNAGVRELMGTQTAQLSQRLLHLRIANQMEKLDVVPGGRLRQLAYHFEMGGDARKAEHYRLLLRRSGGEEAAWDEEEP